VGTPIDNRCSKTRISVFVVVVFVVCFSCCLSSCPEVSSCLPVRKGVIVFLPGSVTVFLPGRVIVACFENAPSKDT